MVRDDLNQLSTLDYGNENAAIVRVNVRGVARRARVKRGDHLPVFRSDDGRIAGDCAGYPRVLGVAGEVDPVCSLQACVREIDCLHYL